MSLGWVWPPGKPESTSGLPRMSEPPVELLELFLQWVWTVPGPLESAGILGEELAMERIVRSKGLGGGLGHEEVEARLWHQSN